MKELPPTAYVIILYTIVMALGLHVAAGIIQTNEIQITQGITLQVDTLESPWWSGFFFISILIMTGLLLILIKYKLDIIIKILAIIAVLYAMTLALIALLGNYGIIAAITLIALTAWKKKNILLYNLTLILTVVGAGALLGASLSIAPSLLLLIILSIYDLIAVFWTKHMVTLAENAKGKLPFMFIIPHKGKTVG
ncbi:MAG: presenilin family intramembrane aspartyl protease, partial [Candidatus Altiarchaeota archaeon]|nr:presenilin family intramembrane aspartyl protease [Candidatus Altiarchaeota archaeon]